MVGKSNEKYGIKMNSAGSLDDRRIGDRPRYDEACFAAHALNLVGDRWALLVVRELMLGPKRFQALRAGLTGISAAVLTTRLEQLARHGVLFRHPQLGYYELTEHGRGLRPVLRELVRWGVSDPGHDPYRAVSPTALMLSMTFLFRGVEPGAPSHVGFDFGVERFTMRIAEDIAADAVTVVPGWSSPPPLMFRGSALAIAHAVYGPRPLSGYLADGTVIVVAPAADTDADTDTDTDADTAQRFLDQFVAFPPPVLPPPADAPD